MQAVLIEDDKSLVWSSVPEPEVEPGYVIVEIYAAGLNRADLLQREGNYPPPLGSPPWMGLEVAGKIHAAPAGSRWKVGDRVCALLGGGGYAERVKVPEGMVLSVPDGLSMAEAAAIPEVFATAYLNLCLESGLAQGDTVFIQAGASGLGLAALQLCKLKGATCVVSVGSEEKAAFVKQLGADVVINRKESTIASVLAKHPPDIALDCVAGPGLGECLTAMAPGGRWVVIATLGGTAATLDMGAFFKKGIRLIGSTLRSRSAEVKGDILSALERDLWSGFSSGSLKPHVYRVLPVSEVEEAHAILARNENIGKVILCIKEENE